MLTLEEIKHLAYLARLEVDEKELEALRGDITAILGYVSEIQKVANARPAAGEDDPTPWLYKVKNVLREDKNPHEGGIYTESILNQAPKLEGKHIKVKKVL